MPQVLLVVIDALTSRVIAPAMADGRLPTFRALAERGSVRFDCRSIFPSITPAATSSIITGRYPCEHGIAGASWYDRERDEVVYYGADFWTILKEGTGHFFNDFLLHLNGERLIAPTLFQQVERRGLHAACLNYLAYRGDVPHKVHVPLPLAILPGVSLTETVSGPSTLCLGDFVAEGPVRTDLESVGGLFHRFGMDDDGTRGFLRSLAGAERLPDFTCAYFADNDYRSHDVGPEAALPTVAKVDECLGEFLAARGGIDAALADLCLIITGDHSQTAIADDAREATLDLNVTLGEFTLPNPGDGWDGKASVMVCPNLRAAQIYIGRAADRPAIVTQLLDEPRVDQVLWRETTGAGEDVYHVATADRGMVSFALTTHGDGVADDYGARWRWQGDLAAVGARIEGDRVVSDDYPNPFERVAGGLRHPNAGQLWVTARPHVELQSPGAEVHVGGGSHGALHAEDSIVPLLIAGAGTPGAWEAPPRTVDVAAVCLQVLGLEPWRRPGESHAAAWR